MRMFLTMTDPPITTYPSIANILSLLWDRKDNIMPWFVDHFIQLVVRPNHEDTFGDFYDHADIDTYYRTIFGLPGLGWMRVNSETVHYDVFSDYVEKQVNNGYALEACLDRYYFPFAENYQQYHKKHSSFIYGYDNDKDEIYIADFFSDNIYSGALYERKVITYKQLNDSMNNDGIINLMKAWDDHYDVNFKLMRKGFDDYLNSTDSMFRFEFSNKDYNHGAIFGLAYYDYLADSFAEKSFLDTRMFHILYDHKKMMSLRLECLEKMHVFDGETIAELKSMNDLLTEETRVLRDAVFKYQIRESDKLKERILNRISKLKDMDKQFVIAMLNAMDKENIGRDYDENICR